MANADACSGAHFTYVWIIENYSELTYIHLKSPLFIAHSISKFEWFLKLEENFGFCCLLQSEDAPREETSAIVLEVSLLAADGTPAVSKKSDDSSFWVHLLTRDAFLERRADFLSNNTLTVQCRMWRKGREIPKMDLCYARTRLKTNTRSFLWPIKQFSALYGSAAEYSRNGTTDDIKVHPLKPFTEKGPFLAMILYIIQNRQSEDVYVDLLIEKGRDYAFSCEISVLDANGKVIQSLEERARTNFSLTFLRFWPVISINKLIANKDIFLPIDTLLLKCFFEVCTGIISSEIEYCTPNVSPVVKVEEVSDFFVEEMDYDPLEFGHYFINDVDENDLIGNSVEKKSDPNCCEDSCSLKVALSCLHREATMSDASLQVGTKLYPVHKNILSSRSPVFSAIFSKDMEQNIIQITDMDENTLCSLLLYIYTNEVEDLQFANALALFKAAAEHQLLDLKNKCSDILIVNLSKDNVRDILSLASKYQDEKLEMAARELSSSILKRFKIIKDSKRLAECNLN